MGRYRHKVYEKSTTPRWVAVFGLQWQIVESHRLEPGACYRQSNTDPIDEVKLTHLGEDGSFFEAADVDPGASSGDTSDGPTGRRIESDREAGGMLAQHRAAVFAQRGSQAL